MKLAIMPLVKIMKMSPDKIAEVLMENLFQEYQCKYEKGFVIVGNRK